LVRRKRTESALSALLDSSSHHEPHHAYGDIRSLGQPSYHVIIDRRTDLVAGVPLAFGERDISTRVW
jgi:hypothetical protein